MLADGYDIVLDLEKSKGRHLYDARHGHNLPGKLLRAEVAVLAVHAVCAGGALQTAVAEFGLADRRACIDVNKRTLRVFGAFPDDVDRAIDGVGAPERTRGTANHLDAIDVGQHHILLIPERARE